MTLEQNCRRMKENGAIKKLGALTGGSRIVPCAVGGRSPVVQSPLTYLYPQVQQSNSPSKSPTI